MCLPKKKKSAYMIHLVFPVSNVRKDKWIVAWQSEIPRQIYFINTMSFHAIKARTQQSIFAFNIRERERERERYGFHAAKEDSYAQKDSYPSSPNQVLQICNVKLEITFSAFTLLLAKRDSIAQNDSHLLKL